MKNLFRYSIISLLLISIVASTTGISVSVHVCSVTDNISLSAGFDSQKHSPVSATCEHEQSENVCDMDEQMHGNSCNVKQTKTDNNILNIHSEDDLCCYDFHTQIEADFDVFPPVKNLSFVDDVLNFVAPVFENELSVKPAVNYMPNFIAGGVSPPYKSNFLNFISSLLE